MSESLNFRVRRQNWKTVDRWPISSLPQINVQMQKMHRHSLTGNMGRAPPGAGQGGNWDVVDCFLLISRENSLHRGYYKESTP